MMIWTAAVLQEAEQIIEEAGPQTEEGRATELEEWGPDR
jgi:hypothetical protein